jgi:hypothetical protein
MYLASSSTVASSSLFFTQLSGAAGTQLARRLIPYSLKVGEQLAVPCDAAHLADASRLQTTSGFQQNDLMLSIWGQ